MPFVDGVWTPSGCYDCDSLTGGRCARHAAQTYTIGTVIPVRPEGAPPPAVPARPFVVQPAPCLPLDQFLYWPKA